MGRIGVVSMTVLVNQDGTQEDEAKMTAVCA
jgi:hypothetical protein